MRSFRFVLVLILIAAGASFLCPGAEAAIQAGDELFITSPVPKNAYLFAGRLVIIERLQADGVLAGGSIVVNAPVRRDLLAAGGDVVVNAPVGGNVRAAGGSVTINGEVGGDLVLAGGRVIVGPATRVAGDLLIAGGEVIIDGSIAGDLRAVGGRIAFNGEVAGTAHFRGSDLSLNGHLGGPAEFAGEDVHLGPAARFDADVVYWQRAGEIAFGPALAPEANAVFRDDLRFAAPRYSVREAGRKAMFAWVSLSFLSGVLMLLLLVFLAPGFTRLAGSRLAGAFWPKTGIGLLYLLATPPLVLLLMITLIGLPLGLFFAFLYGFSLLFAAPLTAATLVRWLELRRDAQWSRGKIVLVGLVLFVAIKLLLFIPVVGWLLVLIPVCAAFGALLTADWLVLLRGDRAISRTSAELT
jgi:cytoskeletal protein CcmA (bactofilin family)